MTGQVWATAAEGGYLYSDELSDTLRSTVQPLTKFRQCCDAEDGTQKGLHRGETFNWNVYSNVGTQGRELLEHLPMPETNFTITQASMTITEYGNSVPYTKKLDNLGKQDVVTIIDKQLKNDARKLFDIVSYLEFNATPLRVAPSGGNSTDSVTLSTGGTTAITNNIGLGADHVKAISDVMKTRDIPPYMGDDYCCISSVTTYRPFKDDLEAIHHYTETGLGLIMHGEIGRYEGIRFVEQNFIPEGGANDTTTFDAYTRTADEWHNAKSSWAFFFGADTVTEAIGVPEEIRAKIPGDYGRSRGVAWYYLGGFKIIHADVTNARIVKWDSAA